MSAAHFSSDVLTGFDEIFFCVSVSHSKPADSGLQTHPCAHQMYKTNGFWLEPLHNEASSCSHTNKQDEFDVSRQVFHTFKQMSHVRAK